MATRKNTATSLLNLQNLDDNSYLKNRLKYHAASRIGIQTGQALAQATNTDGHTVRYNQVWAAKDNEFACNNDDYKITTNGITANIDLVSVFKGTPFINAEPFAYVGSNDTIAVTGKTYYSKEDGKYIKLTEGEDKDWKAGDSLIGREYYEDAGKGTVWTSKNYPAIKLFEQCVMSPVDGSNGSGQKYESYELKYNGARIMDWVAPTSVKDKGIPVPGYTARIEALKGNTWTDLEKCTDGGGAWALAEGNWEFAYISGMCTFHPDNTPNQYSYTSLRITAFQYVGTYLNTALDSLYDNVTANLMAIKPFKFNSLGMQQTRENVYVMSSESDTLDGIILYEDDNNPGTYSAEITTGDTAQLYTVHVANDSLHGNEERYYFDVTIGDSTSVAYFKRGDDAKTTLEGDYGAMMAKGTAMETTLFTIKKECDYAYDKYKVAKGSLYLILPCIVFNVFNAETGLAYGDLTYLEDAYAGYTLVVFEDPSWNDHALTESDTFFAYGFVRGDGNVIPILSMDRSHHGI